MLFYTAVHSKRKSASVQKQKMWIIFWLLFGAEPERAVHTNTNKMYVQAKKQK